MKGCFNKWCRDKSVSSCRTVKLCSKFTPYAKVKTNQRPSYESKNHDTQVNIKANLVKKNFFVREHFACISVHVSHANGWCHGGRKGDQINWNWCYECCEPPCRFWEPNSGPLGEQQMLSSAEPGLLPQK